MLCISLLLIISAITPAFAGTAIDEIDCQRRAKIYSNEYEIRPFGKYEEGFFTHNLIDGKRSLLSMFYNKTRNIYMYCIEPGAPAHSGNTTATDELQNCEFWKNLNRENKRKILLTLMYGFPNVNYPDLCDCDEYAATQALIWEIMDKPNAINIHESDHARAAYDRLKAKLNNFDIKPSFANATVRLKWNGSKYTGSINDTNNILSEFPVISADGINISQSGNILNFSTSAPLKSTVQSTQETKNIPPTDRTLYLFWAADQQTMITGTGKIDPPFFNVKFETDHGTMKIIKKSESGNVSGWEFKITGKGINKTVKTGKDGIISVDLPAQDYIVEEINLPSYMKKPAPQKITVKYHQTATVKFDNEYRTGRVEVIKTDKDTGKTILDGTAIFEVRSKTKSGKLEKIGTMKWDNSKKIYYLNGIKKTEYNKGEVEIVEIKSPLGFILSNKTFKRVISFDGETIKQTVPNERQKGSITYTKTDKDTDKALKDCLVSITAKDDIIHNGEVMFTKGTKVAEKLTDENGKAVFDNLYFGTYIVKEEKAPFGYLNTSEPQEVTLTPDGSNNPIISVSGKFQNFSQKGRIKITKHAEAFTSVKSDKTNDGTEIFTPIYSDIGLSDVVFGLFAKEDIIVNGEVKIKKDSKIEELTTDKNGEAVSSMLYLGKYYIKELQAKTGYIKSSEIKDVELVYNETLNEVSTEISFSNKRQKFEISLLKEMEKDKKANLGGNGEILNVVFGLYAAEEFTAADGKIIPKDALIETGSPDKNGTLKFTADLPQGKVYVKEISTDKAYVLDGKAYNITLKYEGHTIKVIPVFANGEKPIFNKLKSGTLEITKKDISDGKLLPDTGFRIKDENGCVVSEGRTDKNGIAKFSLRYGKYTYQEFDAPKGYLIDEKEYPFEITEDGQIVKAEMKNKKIPENPKPVIPKTGKLEKSAKIQISLYISVGVLSAAAVIIFYLRKKKD